MEVNVHGGKVKDRKGIIVALLIISIIVFLPTLFFTKSLSGKTVGGSSGQVETNNPTNGNLNGGTSGGGNGNSNTAMHTHNYYKKIVQSKYLKSAATCTAKATYYYSCECGEKGTQTFEYGEILPHEYNDSYICTNCSYKCKSDGLSFELSTDNNSYVCTGLGTFDGEILIIPAEHNGKPVTKIEEDAFKNATDITDVLIPDSVTEVGFNAFGGSSNLTKMVLPFVGAYADGSGDENIGYIFGASSYNEQGQKLPSTLKTVVLSDTTTTIGDSAFSGCSSLTSITIGDCVTSIGGSAFYRCNALKTIILPDSVTSIGHFPRTGSAGDMAFMGCSSLENIYYGGSVDEWLQIEGLYDLMNYSSSYKKLYINGELLTEAVINKAAEIKGGAFYGCTSLTSVTIPDSVTSIGSWAFSGCTSLTSVTIPDSVTSIGSWAFSGCTSLTSITIGNGVTSIGSSAFSGCTSLTNVTIGDSVTSIDDYAFYGCTSLQFNRYDNGLYLGNETNKYLVLVKPKTQGVKNITINAECKIIIVEALRGCTSLTSVTIPDRVTSIGSFGYCTSLSSITIGDSVTSIGAYAFECCRSLTSVTIPDSVTNIGNGAFSGCSLLTSITIGNGVTSIGSNAFNQCRKLVEVINNSSLDIKKGSSGYGGVAYFALSVKKGGESDIKNQGEYQFITVDGINYLINYVGTDTEITLPASYNGQNYVINDYAFYDCTSLTSVTIPDSMSSIGDRAFSSCSSLISITIPDNVTSIGSYAFWNCTSLKTINYKGSEKQWDAISKGYDWNYGTGSYTINYNYVEQ